MFNDESVTPLPGSSEQAVDVGGGEARRDGGAPRFRKAIQIAVSISLTILMGYIIYRDVPDWRKSLQIVLQGNLLLVLAGLLCVFLHMVLRAVRWGALLSPSKSSILFNNLFSLTLVKYVINLIPPRSGEVVASVLLAKKEAISSATVIAASIFERILDLVTVFVISACCLIVIGPNLETHSEAGRTILVRVRSYSIIGFLVLAAGMAVLIFLLRDPRWLGRIPARIRNPITGFMEGFRALQSHGTILRAVILSLAIWICIIFQVWFLIQSYIGPFPLWGIVLIVVLTAVGVAIPTPGGIGGYQYFMSLGLVHFFRQHLSVQDPHTQAAGISNGCYLISTLPVLIAGLVYLNREGLSLGKISKICR
jgi:glycosyltransferase 2 family protein